MHFQFNIFHLAMLTGALASPIEKRDSRTSNPDSCLEVGSGYTYSTLQAAVTALGSSTSTACIFIHPGSYNEQVRIDYGGNLTLYGYTTDTSNYKNNVVTIYSSETSSEAGTLDASSAVQFVSDNVKVYNIIFENTYGEGSQAVAMTGNADYLGFYGCSFIGYQDTLYAKAGAQYYKRCYIEGADDFIFGDAAAWWGDCDIVANGGGSITANSREDSDDTAWYVIDSSYVYAKDGLDLTEEVYLGRPWRVLARVIYQNTDLSDIINPAGWTTLADDATPIFEEYNNSGDGSDTSDRVYETTATAAVTKKELWGGDYDSWIDSDY